MPRLTTIPMIVRICGNISVAGAVSAVIREPAGKREWQSSRSRAEAYGNLSDLRINFVMLRSRPFAVLMSGSIAPEMTEWQCATRPERGRLARFGANARGTGALRKLNERAGCARSELRP